MIPPKQASTLPPGCREPLQRREAGELRQLSKTVLKACGDAYFQPDELRDFDLKIRRGGVATRVRHGGQLLRRRATARLADFFLPLLREPPPGLRFLVATLRGLQGKPRLTLVLEGEVRRGAAGFFRHGRREGAAHLVDTLSPRVPGRFETGLMDAATLYHELGHHLMFELYGRALPDYRGHRGHDATALRHWEAETNPGAAWSEGFAGAMANLDYRSSKGMNGAGDLDPAWFEKNLRARLSNEYTIAALLTDYIKSRVVLENGWTETVLDAAAFSRLGKIFRTMRRKGLQEDFGDFVRDFLARHPEEGRRFNPLLRDYGFGELASDRVLRP